MSKQGSIPMDRGGGERTPMWVRNVFFGGVIGLVTGLAAVFLAAALYGEHLGFGAGQCAAFACTFGMMLSQPAMLGGMVAGVAGGAVVGAFAHRLHRG